MAPVPSQASAPSSTGDGWNVFEWFTGPVKAWLGGLAGDVASGVEGGIIATIKDLMAPIIPFIEIFIGAMIFIWVVGFYFRDDVKQILPLLAMAIK